MTNTITNTVTLTSNTNELSISSSPKQTSSDLFDPTEDNKSFLPLTPKINIYFENAFLSNSPSNRKKE